MSNYFRNNVVTSPSFSMSLGVDPFLLRTQANLFNSATLSPQVVGITGPNGAVTASCSICNVGSVSMLNLSFTGTALTGATSAFVLPAGTIPTGYRPLARTTLPSVVTNATGPFSSLGGSLNASGTLTVDTDGSVTVRTLPSQLCFTGPSGLESGCFSWKNN